MRKVVFLLFLMLAIGSPQSFSQQLGIDVTAGLEQDYVLVGGTATLVVTVTVTGGQNAPAPQLVGVPDGLTITPLGGRQTNMTAINGAVTSTETYRYQVEGKVAGDYTLSGISVVQGGNSYSAPPVKIPVIRPEQADQYRKKDPNLFAEIQFDKNQVYVGEQANLTLVMWQRPGVRANYSGVQDFDPASFFKGFIWQTLVDRPSRLNSKSLNGVNYERVQGFRVAVFPIGAGDYSLGPLTAVADRGSFFNSQRYALQTNVAELKVLPIPADGRPPEFEGAVGSYGMTASVDRQDVAVGDIVTLKVIVQGVGNIDSLPEPVLPDLSGFDQFDPRSNREKGRQGDQLGGKATFEYLLSPQNVSATQIGPVRFAFFNPDTAKFQVISTPAINLKVSPAESSRGSAAAGQGSVLSPQGVVVLGEDFRHIATDVDGLRNDAVAPYSAIVPGLYALPLLLMAGTLVVRRRKAIRERNPVLARRLEAYSNARKGIIASRETSSMTTLYAEMAQVMVDYLSDTLNRSVGGLTTPEIREALEGQGISEERTKKVIGFLERCDAARFGAGAGIDSPDSLRGETEHLLESLEKEGLGKGTRG